MPATAAPPLPKQVTAGQLAKLLDLTERTILGRTADGRLPKTDDSHVDLRAIVEAGVAALASRGPQEGTSLEFEKARLAREQADQIALKNEVLRGKLVPIKEINEAMIGMIEVTKRHLARVPAKAFPNPADIALRKPVAEQIEAALIDLSAVRVVPTSDHAPDA